MTRTTASAPKRTTLTLDDRRLLPEGWVTTYVEDACTAIPSPPVWNLAAALALAAHSLAKSGWTIEGGHRTRTALPFAILSKSGSGKGLAINYLRQFLFDFYNAHDLPSVLLDACLKDEDTDTYKAALLEFTGTPEGLFWEMEERLYPAPNILREDAKASCVLGVHDEMHELFARNRNHPYFFTGIIAAQDQHPEIRRTQVNIKQMKKEKVAGRTGIIPNPALSTLFATAEARLREVIKAEDLTGGFCSRFMWLAQPEDWRDPRTIDDDWLSPRDETDRDSSLPARVAYRNWLLSIIGIDGPPGRIVFDREEIRAWNTPNVKHWMSVYASADLGEAGARADIHLLMLAAAFAGAEGKIAVDVRGRLIRVEQRHYQLANDLYQHIAKGVAWLFKTGREQDAPTVLELLYSKPQGLTALEIARALSTRNNDVERWIENLLKQEEVVGACLERGGRGARKHLYFHARFYPQIKGKKYKNGPLWEITPAQRAAIYLPEEPAE